MEDDARQIGESILRKLEQAWNAGDGAGFGAPFTEDADFVDIRGQHHRGREAIARGHQGIFDSIYRGSTVRYQLSHARRLSDDVILVHSAGTMDVPSGPMAGIHRAIPSLVLVRGGGGWQVAAFHNTLVTG